MPYRFKLESPRLSKPQWEKQTSICPRCGAVVSNKSYYSSSHIRGTCGKKREGNNV